MKNFLFILTTLLLVGCCSQSPSTVNINFTETLTLNFPAHSISPEDSLTLYDKDHTYLGFIQRNFLPEADQPASDFITRALNEAKADKRKTEEINTPKFIGYVVYSDDTATLHFAEKDIPDETFLVGSVNREAITKIKNILINK